MAKTKHELPDGLFAGPDLTLDERYWLGFVAARLSVYGDNVRFSIDAKHVHLLRDFANLFHYTGTLYFDEAHNSYQFRITNAELLKRFEMWGITGQRREPISWLWRSPRFWRGFLDPKGTLYTHESGRQTYSFSTRFVDMTEAFANFCDLIEINCKIYRRGAGSYQVFVTNAQDIVKLINVLQGDRYGR